MDAFVEIIRPDGSAERHRIEGERSTIGRSPAAGITLTGFDQLEAEHLMVAPRADGCWVAVAQNAKTPAMVRGAAFSSGLVPWGTEIEVGNLKLKVTDALPATKKAQKTSSPVMLLGVVAVGLAGWLLLSDDSSGLPDIPTSAPPSLFPAQVACPAQGPAALVTAQHDAEDAEAKSERYVFASQDGVQAVRLYMESAACFAAAGYSQDALRVTADKNALAQRVDGDYRAHRLRLEQALQYARFDDALLETRALRALTHHLDPEDRANGYVRYLEILQRRLQLLNDQSLAAGGAPAAL